MISKLWLCSRLLVSSFALSCAFPVMSCPTYFSSMLISGCNLIIVTLNAAVLTQQTAATTDNHSHRPLSFYEHKQQVMLSTRLISSA